ncbi:SAM-dependent methyltransferase [Lysobacter enzymogenes]|uniref:SAM-dependent methyltransferase n=1 Tax=Lysobacter enzymogenes TaxID=69 RepID=UPI001AF81DCC|nr:cyclopropane-fatty-acyl-phospholipid synthase family protein [Lysobacter enzymogenes]QQQ00858.1 class I SAM-dependent methyltransferase [Lysobacter enzymogenes]
MNPSSAPNARRSGTSYTGLDALLRRRLIETLAALRYGHIRLRDEFGELTLGAAQTEDPERLEATVTVHDPGFYRALAANGSVGAGEAFIDGLWDCDDLVALVRLLVRNRDLLDSMEGGWARIGGWALRAWHRLRRNTRAGSRRNIAAHYDLGNEFFATFLSTDLMYSSAVYAEEGDTLEVASQRKLDRICRKLGLCPGDRVIEIGTGWGGFAVHAAGRYGCHVTTTTVSREQHAAAAMRVREAGVEDRVTLLLEDYRDLRGEYDKLVSIEMVEAVGADFLPSYFERVGALLAPNGLAMLQAITIEDHRYQRALREVDFIKRFVFPGSFIPSVAALLDAKTRACDLALVQLDDFGPSYALTLQAWRLRFVAARARIEGLGYDRRFLRLWEFYLCYCEGGFRERSIGVAQMLLAKPGHRRAVRLPEVELLA